MRMERRFEQIFAQQEAAEQEAAEQAAAEQEAAEQEAAKQEAAEQEAAEQSRGGADSSQGYDVSAVPEYIRRHPSSHRRSRLDGLEGLPMRIASVSIRLPPKVSSPITNRLFVIRSRIFY